ncbi:MAG: M1 family metallopeptidase [Saprospiraceae bacterium]|jgi:aminopeptidase N
MRFILSLPFLSLLFFPLTGVAQTPIYDSGGVLSPEQASYDVTFYDLSIQVFPEAQRIAGTLEVRARIVHPMNVLVLDLDTLLAVSGAVLLDDGGLPQALSIQRKGGKIWIALGKTRQAGEDIRVQVHYGGKPRIAPRAPWDGGFDWKKTSSGAHWIATSCQGEGADIWWPVKDHVSDEPDSMGLHVRVPKPLVAACNGRLSRTEDHGDGTATYHWYVSTPINVYNIALNIAPYRVIQERYTSIVGESFPLMLYVLPEDYEKGKILFEEIKEHIAFYEKLLGPYPFRKDKYGVAQTPHLGMEHQSIIAYGANFKNTSMTGGVDWGFDALHHHEFGHEWWGNLVTNYNWQDMWIHEGFCTYMQALYVEEKQGKSRYLDFMASQRRFGNELAVAPREILTSDGIYRAPIYSKGAWVLHVLRGVIGDEAFFSALRRMAYPSADLEKVTDGRQCRFATTDDFLLLCEEISGMDLDWFFEVYLRQPRLPRLYSRIEGQELTLRWEAPGGLPFPMPVEVGLDGKVQRVPVGDKAVTVKIPRNTQALVDPNRWLLCDLVR